MTEKMASPEVAKEFDRVSGKVNLKGATDAAEIEKRMEFKVDLWRTRAKIVKTKWAKKRNRRNANWFDTMIEHGFPDRVILEAIKAPKGIIAQTLLHGKEEAKRRVLAYRRQRIKAA